MRFWLVAVIDSVPVRLVALFIRIVGWLVVASATVIWWGPGDSIGNPGRAVVGFAVGGLVWAAGMTPRWFVDEVLFVDDR